MNQNKVMDRVASLVAVAIFIVLDMLAIHDIQERNQPNYFWEYTTLLLSFYIFFLAYKQWHKAEEKISKAHKQEA